MMTDGAHKLDGVPARQRWHNEIPEWIRRDAAYARLSPCSRLVLQAIADHAEAPDQTGSLLGAFGGRRIIAAAGCSASTFWSARKCLELAGFVVLLGRGGAVWLHKGDGTVKNVSNTWGLPGTRGALDASRVRGEIARMVTTPTGDRVRMIDQPGEQAAFWPLAPRRPTRERTASEPVGTAPAAHAEPGAVSGTVSTGEPVESPAADFEGFPRVLRNSEWGTPKFGVGYSEIRSLPSPIEPPLKNHDGHGAFTGENEEGRDSKARIFSAVPHIVSEDVRDTGALVELYTLCMARNVVSSCDADRLWFFGAAEHALRCGRRNPAGLFATMLRDRGRFEAYVTVSDETAALARLQQFARAGGVF